MKYFFSILLMTILSNFSLYAQNEEQLSNDYSVGLKDMRDHEVWAAKVVAAKLSKETIIVLFMGSDLSLAKKIRASASNAKDNGCKVKGMIWANTDTSFIESENSVLVVVNGIPYGQADASIYPNETVQKLIEHAMKEYPEELGFSKTKNKR
jgi:hypothetical protein